VPLTSAKSIASTVMGGIADVLQPTHQRQHESRSPDRVHKLPGGGAMSHRAIAAALVLDDLSAGGA
jgi:hypothetical protein